MASAPPPYTTGPHNYNSIEQQQTMPIPAVPEPLIPPIDTSPYRHSPDSGHRHILCLEPSYACAPFDWFQCYATKLW